MSHRLLLLLAVTGAALFCAVFAFAPGFDNGFWRDDFTLLERSEAARQHLPVLLQRWVEPFNRPLAQAAFVFPVPHRTALQAELSRHVVLKYTPHLIFHLDESIKRGARVLEILDDLGKHHGKNE